MVQARVKGQTVVGDDRLDRGALDAPADEGPDAFQLFGWLRDHGRETGAVGETRASGRRRRHRAWLKSRSPTTPQPRTPRAGILRHVVLCDPATCTFSTSFFTLAVLCLVLRLSLTYLLTSFMVLHTCLVSL